MELNICDIVFSGNKNFTMRNEICLNRRIAYVDFPENELVEVMCGHVRFYATITYIESESHIKAFLSADLKKHLIDGEDKITILKLKQSKLKKYNLAKIGNLQTEKVEISKDIFENFAANKENKYVIVNNLNGYRMDVLFSDLIIDESSSGSIRLGIKHRRLLDLELPTFISNTYLTILGEKINKYYNDEAKNVTFENYYIAANEFKEIYSENAIDILTIYEIKNDNNADQNLLFKFKAVFAEKIVNRILDKFIRQRKVLLRVVRPYPSDESESILRVSETTMKLLGLDETDSVVIRNGIYSCKAKILKIEDNHDIALENRIKNGQEFDVIIGVPAFIRAKLNLSYINCVVSVERDLSYLFKKDLKNQIMSIIGFLVSMPYIIKVENIIIRTFIIMIVIVALLYLSFSSIREKVPNK